MYSSLHNHSEYSILDGYGHPKEMLEQASKVGIKAYAITEHGNEYSYPYFSDLHKSYPDIKLLFGVEFYECYDHTVKDKDSKYFHLIAIAKNEQGRIALNELITKSNFEGFYYKPRIDLNMIKPYADNLIVSSACLASKIARESDFDKCIEYVLEYKSVFKHFYLEMQSHGTPEQCEYNKKILELSKACSVPFIIATDSHAATKDDLEYQALHVQIARDKETGAELYSGCYLQSEDEIHEIMDAQIGYDNVCIGLNNTNEIADLCDDVDVPWSEPQLPTFPLDDGFETNYDMLVHLCELGWNTRGICNKSEDEQQVYRKRLEYELSIIHTMKFDGYFLFCWDYVNYAKDNDIIVGDGRGSGGGSLVVFLLNITELDPIENNLIFERFLNPERVSMPDLDIDFADRQSIINYLSGKYGEDHVCQILNISYITPNVSIKDVGRVLGIPYNITDKIAKKFVYETFEECMSVNSEIVSQMSEYNELFHIASKISGRVRNVSMHAGGVVVYDDNVTNHAAMKLGANGEHVIQVDKKVIERIGGIKFDILGVRTLKVVQDAMNMAGLCAYDVSINNPAFANDNEMYKILCEAKTNGVFQTESQGMKDLLVRLQPSSLEDVSAVLALYRPDSMPMLEEFIDNKIHHKRPTYIHDDMGEILDRTYGALIYQEQLMDIVRKFGGRSYGGADKFRKGIGKKDKALIKAESEKLYQEIIDNGYEESVARQISDTLSEKGGYLFNHCVSGRTVLMQCYSGTYSLTSTVEKMYIAKNDFDIGYGTALSMCDDNVVRANRIVDIRYSGRRKLFRVTTESGATIECTDNHKFPTVDGIKELKDICTDDELYEIIKCETPHIKGIPTNTSRVVSIEYIGVDNVYDIEMNEPNHNFVTSTGIVTCNSHSALYSILTLKTAYLKAHYPAEFFCALLNQNLNDFGAINKYILEARDFNIEVLHPHINRSQREFSIYDGKILFGLSAIKGIGSSVVDAIMLERENGKFTNLSDLLYRVKLTTAQVVALIKAGAIPTKDKHNALLKYCEMILPEASEYKPVSTLPTKAKLLIEYGIDAGIVTDKDERLRLLNVIKRRQHEDKQAEKLSNARKGFIAKYMSDEQFWEFETLSVFISNNPFEKAARHLTTSFSSISDGDKCTIVGVISSVQKKKDKNKNQFCFVNINSLDGFLELTAWSSQYKLYSEFLVSGSQVAVLAKKSDDKAVIEQVKPYSQWLEDRNIK